ncbi:hypothetical protein ACFO3I_08345 [Rheinheimera marina]|uniref:Uncharacterized protein n=1 Tax=Rheinheimera marina TaxID=1774958 RepID=A0ABV9JLD3_9GAMM
MTKTELRAAGLGFMALSSILALGAYLPVLTSPLQSCWSSLLF